MWKGVLRNIGIAKLTKNPLRNSAFAKDQEEATMQRITNLEQTNHLLLAKYETGDDGQKKVDGKNVKQSINIFSYLNLESRLLTFKVIRNSFELKYQKLQSQTQLLLPGSAQVIIVFVLCV